jgi:hypothetical protein
MSRHHRNIEEEFRAIAPEGRRGIPSAQPIAVGVTGSGGADSSASQSQASQEITQLEAQFKQQADLIQANTQALQSNTGAHGASVGGSIESTAASFLGGSLGLFSPIVSGLLSLFGVGGSSSAPAPLPFYTPPPSVQMSDTLRTATPSTVSAGSPTAGGGSGSSASNASAAPQVTVNVSAMDSQSFMDRSGDIANAVRQAMLNLHPINDVVASL